MGQNVYILFEGLFFLEYKEGCLYVTAPSVTDHDYRIGNPEDSPLQYSPQPPNNVLDWRSNLTGSSKISIPNELLTFSKSEAGTGDITDDPTEFRLRVILPRPLEMLSLRNGDRSEFPAVQGNVWSSISGRAKSPNMGLVTCLRYQGSFPDYSTTNRCHFYAECDCDEDVDHTNHAYRCAKSLFSGYFDLQLDTTKTPSSLPPLPPDVDNLELSDLQNRNQDELSLFEILSPHNIPVTAVNVANCGQFGVLNP